MPLVDNQGVPQLLGTLFLLDIFTNKYHAAPLYPNLEVWVVGGQEAPVYLDLSTNRSLAGVIDALHTWEVTHPADTPPMKYKVQGISILPGMFVFMDMEIKEESTFYLVDKIEYKEELDEETKGYCLAVRAGLYERCHALLCKEEPGVAGDLPNPEEKPG